MIYCREKVYTAARDHFPSLRDNTTRIVIKDMVRVKSKSNFVLICENYSKVRIRTICRRVQQFAPAKRILKTLFTTFGIHKYDRPSHSDIDYNLRAPSNPPLDMINTGLFRQGAVELLKDVANQEEDNEQLVLRVRKLASDITLHDIGVLLSLRQFDTYWKTPSTVEFFDPDENLEDKPWAKAGHTLLTQSIVAFSRRSPKGTNDHSRRHIRTPSNGRNIKRYFAFVG